MAEHQRLLSTWSQYLGARLTSMALTMFDVEPNLRTASAVGRALFYLDRRHRRRACYNISLAFDHWSAEHVERVGRDSFEHLLQLVVEVCHAPRLLTLDTFPYRVDLNNLGPAVELLNARKPVILVTGHLGNWEVLGYLLALLGYRIDAIARPIDNRLINDWLLSIRQRRGLRIITKFNATERMMDVLGQGGALGFIADQNAGYKGLFVPFFGRLASTYKSIGLLAMNQNVPIICGYTHRVGGQFRYELGVTDVIRPEDWQDRPDPLFYITARYTRAIETMVRMRPDQYLWVHRRWRHRPRHEEQGKPIPRALRRQLESLPWMDDELMHRLSEPPPPLANHTAAAPAGHGIGQAA